MHFHSIFSFHYARKQHCVGIRPEERECHVTDGPFKPHLVQHLFGQCSDALGREHLLEAVFLRGRDGASNELVEEVADSVGDRPLEDEVVEGEAL